MNRFMQPVLMFCAIGFLSAIGGAQQIQVNKDNRTIAITTSDTAKAMADLAHVHIGFMVYAPDAKTAYANASDISNAIINSLTKSGIAKDAIQSDAQNISEAPVYQPGPVSDAERQKRRFQVTQSWTVETSAKDAAEVMNMAINAGANNSGQIDWMLKNDDALQSEAAANALQHARQIAEQMAKGLNTTLGALVYASNEAPLTRTDRFVGGAIDGRLALKAAAPKPLSVSPQQVIQSATVYAVFALQ